MKKPFSCILLLAASAFLCSCSHSEYLDNPTALAPHLINARRLQQPQGPHIVVSKLKDDKTLEDLESFYKLTPQGFQPGDRYYGHRVNGNYAQQYLGEFIVQENGDLLWKSIGMTIGSMHHSRAGGFINGEQWFHVLVSEDKQNYIVTLMTHDPIEYQWKDGAYVSLALVNQTICDFFLAGKGFIPNEEVLLNMVDNDFHFNTTVKADGQGMLQLALPSLIPNKENEKAALTLTRQNTDEIPTLSFLYGRAALVKALPDKYPNVESVNLETCKSSPPITIILAPQKQL